MMRRNPKHWPVRLSLLSLVGLFAISPASLAQPEIEAQVAWKAQKFSEFLTLSIERDKKQSNFSSAFNIALGLYMTGQAIEALKKVVVLQLTPEISETQRAKINILRTEIEDHLKYLEVYQFSRGLKFNGTATLSTGQKAGSDQCKRFKSSQICPPSTPPASGRAERPLSLKPDEHELYLKALSLKAVESSGYDVTPKTKTRFLPEE